MTVNSLRWRVAANLPLVGRLTRQYHSFIRQQQRTALAARVDTMSFRLLSLTENSDIMLDKPIILVGRHKECDVQIHSRKISRKHCCIAQVNNYVVVRDLFSTNGVSINGQRVEEGSLHAGDELSIAHFRYQVTVAGQGASAIAPANIENHPVLYDPAETDGAPATEKGLGEDETQKLNHRKEP